MSEDGATHLVIFGASGDLTRRKILPALKSLADRGVLPDQVRLVGVGRSEMSTEKFRKLVHKAAEDGEISSTAEYVQIGYESAAAYGPLKKTLRESDSTVFYLATPPATFAPIVSALNSAGLTRKGNHASRVVVEKPLGHDLQSAREINAELARAFDEEQVFRIDHYLAKDTVQNVLAFRFSNSVFEPIWNRTLVQSIQLTVAEEEGIGSRAGYYDQTGAVRDIIQNHALQVLALVTMEPPTTFDADDIRNAKLEALRAMRPLDPNVAVRGQYEGYLQEDGVAPSSRRETYMAAHVSLDNWRWEGVPIYMRCGKGLRKRVTEVVIRFRDAPHLRIGELRQRTIPTLLVLRIQPDESIMLRIGAKRPGTRFEMVPAGMKLEYTQLSREGLPDAYEHVLYEVLVGGRTVFPSGEEIDRAWEIVDPLLKAWETEGHPEIYKKGSWGPLAADELLASTGGGRWINSGDEPGI